MPVKTKTRQVQQVGDFVGAGIDMSIENENQTGPTKVEHC
jgi:hypothetical protein